MAQNLTTAMVLRGAEVEWTTLRQAKGQVEKVETRRVELDGPAEPTSADVANRVRASGGHPKGRLCLAIPSEKVLMRVVDLPATDPDEVRGMAELQLDKFSPFPVEHMAVSLELLSQQENTSRVLIAAVQKEVIDALGAVWGKAGHLPYWIDVETMAWWHLLQEKGEIPDRGRRAVVILDRSATQIMVSQDGVPVTFRSLGAQGGASDEEFLSELAEEISYTLTTLEAERGSVANTRIALWYWGEQLPPKLTAGDTASAKATQHEMADPPGGLLQKLRDACGVDVDKRNLAVLPPLSEGLARRVLARGPMAIDLAPATWRTEAEGRQFKQVLLVALAAFLALWGLGVAAFWGVLQLKRNGLAQLKTAVSALEEPAERIRTVSDRIRSFEAYADRSHSALECLREVSVRQPDGVDLTAFTFNKGDTLVLRGFADTPEPIYAFFQALQESPLFVKVSPEAVQTRTVGGVAKPEFTVVANLPGKEKEP